jgi:hypothetical protein
MRLWTSKNFSQLADLEGKFWVPILRPHSRTRNLLIGHGFRRVISFAFRAGLRKRDSIFLENANGTGRL